MKRSKKLSLTSGPEISSTLEPVETKEIEYKGHKYVYSVDKYTMFKDYYALTVEGGPHKYYATTTCKKASIKKTVKQLILSLSHR